MTIPYYEVLAFTSRPFAGNPAGVCILNEWLPDQLLQQIAAENSCPSVAANCSAKIAVNALGLVAPP
jgi:predicted PhzF superfamily epimerase YddE/YHI9